MKMGGRASCVSSRHVLAAAVMCTHSSRRPLLWRPAGALVILFAIPSYPCMSLDGDSGGWFVGVVYVPMGSGRCYVHTHTSGRAVH